VERRSISDWILSPYGVPGRASAAVVALVAMIVTLAMGKFAAAFVLLIVAALSAFSAVRVSRREGRSSRTP
jgi:hypothetical protein